MKTVITLLLCSISLTDQAVDGGTNAPIVQGTLIATVLGPSSPTPEAVIPSKPGSLTNFWVSLQVRQCSIGFAPELKGKVVRLPSSEFEPSLVGQTLPLLVSYSPGRYPDSDYWLMCTSVPLASLAAGNTNEILRWTR